VNRPIAIDHTQADDQQSPWKPPTLRFYIIMHIRACSSCRSSYCRSPRLNK